MPAFPATQETDLGGSRLEAIPGKKVDPILINKPGVVVHAYDPSCQEGTGRRTVVQSWPWQKVRPYLKK
jgi:hypothetical protein